MLLMRSIHSIFLRMHGGRGVATVSSKSVMAERVSVSAKAWRWLEQHRHRAGRARVNISIRSLLPIEDQGCNAITAVEKDPTYHLRSICIVGSLPYPALYSVQLYASTPV